MKKYILILLPLLLNCGSLDRDNLLDPKNPNSNADQVVLVELFINDSTGYEFCDTALETIEDISESENYHDKILVLEYHVKTDDLNDFYALTSSYERYLKYVPIQSNRGIPDAFFNGKIERVQGASTEKAKLRYEDVLEELTGKKAYFRIEATKRIEGNSIDLDVKVARLGSWKNENLNLMVVLYEDLGTNFHRNVVRKIFQHQAINTMKPGEVKSFGFTGQLSGIQKSNAIYALVFVQDQEETTMEIYQAAKF